MDNDHARLSDSPPAPQAALAALSLQLDCYRQLLPLSRAQSEHIGSRETDKLLQVLTRREALTLAAAEAEEALGPIKRDWPESAAGWTAAEREAAGALFRQCRDLLGEITRQDELDAAALRACLALTANARARADMDSRIVRKINQRYASAAYGAPARRLDRSS